MPFRAGGAEAWNSGEDVAKCDPPWCFGSNPWKNHPRGGPRPHPEYRPQVRISRRACPPVRPQSVSMAWLSQHRCDAIARKLNTRPRKRLWFRTPLKYFNESQSALHFKVDVRMCCLTVAPV